MAKTSTDVAKTDVPAHTPAVVRPAGPLNQTQLKNLEKIVEGDFEDLKQEVTNTISQRRSRRVEEIEAEYAKDSKKTDKARDAMQTAVRKAEEQLTAALAKQTETGVIIAGSEKYDPKHKWVTISAPTLFVIAGKDEAITKVNTAAQRLTQTALRVINRKRSETVRKVLLQGIAADNAVELVNGLPKSEDIMNEVQAAVKIDNEDDLQQIGLVEPTDG